jgi:hypothetical protein
MRERGIADAEEASRRQASRTFRLIAGALAVLLAVPFAFTASPIDWLRLLLAIGAAGGAAIMLSMILGHRRLVVCEDCFFASEIRTRGLLTGKDLGRRRFEDVSGIYVREGRYGVEVWIRTVQGDRISYLAPPPNAATRALIARIASHDRLLPLLSGRETWNLTPELAGLLGITS